MSNKNLALNVTQAAEILRAARNANYEAVDLKQLSSVKVLKQILPVLQGYASVVMKSHIINCDANPFIPEGWEVVEHKKGGQFEFNPSQIKLYLSQQKGIIGHDLRKELANKPVLNANVLDYLLQHCELIPDFWKGKYVFFWGTIYRHSYSSLCVRYLFWRGAGWNWSCGWLDGGFSDDDILLRCSE